MMRYHGWAFRLRGDETSYEVQWGSNWCSDFDVLQAGKSVEDLPSDLLHYSDAGDVQGVIENANSPAMAVAVLLRQLTR